MFPGTEEEELEELTVTRGEVTPPTTPNNEKRSGIVRRSPRAHAKNRSRLPRFQQECEKRGLPPSRLQEQIRKEERTSSVTSSPRLRPARDRREEVVGRDLRECFERLRAEAQLCPLDTCVKEAGKVGQEDQTTRSIEGSCGTTLSSTVKEPACRQCINMQIAEAFSVCG